MRAFAQSSGSKSRGQKTSVSGLELSFGATDLRRDANVLNSRKKDGFGATELSVAVTKLVRALQVQVLRG